MKLTLTIGLTLLVLGSWILIHRFSFHLSGDGLFLYRCNTITGSVSFANARDRVWTYIADFEKAPTVPHMRDIFDEAAEEHNARSNTSPTLDFRLKTLD